VERGGEGGGGKRSITLILDQWVVCVWYRGGCFFVSKEGLDESDWMGEERS
jgi:hypothetical protein